MEMEKNMQLLWSQDLAQGNQYAIAQMGGYHRPIFFYHHNDFTVFRFAGLESQIYHFYYSSYLYYFPIHCGD